MSAQLSAQRLQLERDLFRECLELPKASNPGPLLNQTLSLLCRLVDADCGYIELTDAAEGGQTWTSDEHVDESQRELIRKRVSRGIVAAAIEEGEVVHTDSALLDARFSDRASVRSQRLGEVVCVPLHADGVLGVVYLENRTRAPHFDAHDITCAQAVAGFAATVAARLLQVLGTNARTDPTAEVRAQLKGEQSVTGRSPALAVFLRRLATVAKMESNVLFTGAAGSGKSMFAKLLHRNSRRAAGPFVELNCAALPPELIESELFGSERGAHSAVADRSLTGKVTAAEKGTLFLDEVGELDPRVQAKLLQLVQHKTFMRLGGTTMIHADVRILSATNVDVDAAQERGQLRRDFFDRLSSIRLTTPTLAERQQDIPLLVRAITDKVCQTEQFPAMTLTAAALAAVEFSEWPGNVRELQNACKNAIVNARLDGTTALDVHHFFPDATEAQTSVQTFRAARVSFERMFLSNALHQREWNVAQTARELDMSRSHLNALIRKYEIER